MAKFSEKFDYKFPRYGMDDIDCKNIREYIESVFPLPTEKKSILFFARDGKESFETLQTRLTDDYLMEKMDSHKEFSIRAVVTMLPNTMDEWTEEFLFTFRAFKHCVYCGTKNIER